MNRKQGFSLVEVMVIFTVLSVVLAASIPMITKKANPVHDKIAHGVYRCIHTDSGLLEEVYSGSRRISSNVVQKCSFNVPKAAQYKVDMYSAGSGGTLFAKVKGNRDDERQVDFTMANGYVDETNGDPILRPSEVELAKLFNGKYLVQSVYTGDAGNGGNADLTYESPYEASCGITNKSVYDEEIKDLQDKIKSLQEELNKADKIYNKIKFDLKDIDSYYYSDIIYPGDPDVDAMVWCKDGSTTYLNLGGEWLQNLWFSAFCTYETKRVNNLASNKIIIPIIPDASNSEQADYVWFCWTQARSGPNQYPEGNFHWERFRPYCGYGYADFYDKVSRICDEMINAIAWSGKVNVSKLKSTKQAVLASYLPNSSVDSMRRLIDAATIDDDNDAGHWEILNLTWQMNTYQRGKRDIHIDWNAGVKDMVPYTIAASAGLWFDDLATRFQDTYNSITTKEEEEAIKKHNELGKEIEELEKRIEELKTERGYNGGLIRENQKSLPTFKTTYNNVKYTNNPTVRKQVENFCKVVFKNYYELSGLEPKNTVEFGTRRIAKLGGDGGKGKFSRLIYRINYNPRIHTGGFTKYLQDLMNPRSSVAYYPVYCTSKTNTSTCTKDASKYTDHVGAIKKANDGNSITARYLERANTALFSLVNSIASHFGYTIFSKDIKKLAVTSTVHSSSSFNSVQNGVGNNDYMMYNDPCDPKNLRPGQQMPADCHKDVELIYPSSEPSPDTPSVTTPDTPSVTTPDTPTSSGTYRKLNTTKGSNLTVPYVGWHISGESTPKIAVNTMPTGGEGKVLYVDEANESKTYTNFTGTLANAHKIFSTNYAGIVGEKVRVKGQDATFNNIQASVYKIDAVNASDTGSSIVTSFDSSTGHPYSQEPYLRIKSDLWTKSYQLGSGGNIGKTSSVVVGNLGNQCTFNVPAPGRVYEKGTSRGDLNKLNAMLSTSIQCRNQNGVVYEDTLAGNNYNDFESTEVQVKYDDSTILPNFRWSEKLEDVLHQVEVSLKDSTPQQKTWRQTSIWAKIYKKYMVHDNVYDLKSLGVGQAGRGTTLTDKCVARRGQYEAQMRYNLKYYTINESRAAKEVTPGAGDKSGILQRSSTYEQSHDLNTDGPEAKKLEYQNGDYQGFNCYGVQNSADTNVTRSEFSITTNSDIHKKGIMEIRAGKGGGGAVVITW